LKTPNPPDFPLTCGSEVDAFLKHNLQND